MREITKALYDDFEILCDAEGVKAAAKNISMGAIPISSFDELIATGLLWDEDEEIIKQYKCMFETGQPLREWGWESTEYKGVLYFWDDTIDGTPDRSMERELFRLWRREQDLLSSYEDALVEFERYGEYTDGTTEDYARAFTKNVKNARIWFFDSKLNRWTDIDVLEDAIEGKLDSDVKKAAAYVALFGYDPDRPKF